VKSVLFVLLCEYVSLAPKALLMLLAHGSSGHWPVALASAAGVHCAAAGKKVRTRDAVHTLLILFQFSKVRCRPGRQLSSQRE